MRFLALAAGPWDRKRKRGAMRFQKIWIMCAAACSALVGEFCVSLFEGEEEAEKKEDGFLECRKQ